MPSEQELYQQYCRLKAALRGMSSDLDSKTEDLREHVRLELDAQYSQQLGDLRHRLEAMSQQRVVVEVHMSSAAWSCTG